jgi:hypothetical protein
MLPGYGCLNTSSRPTLPEPTNSLFESESARPDLLPHVSSTYFPTSFHSVPMSPATLGSRSSTILGPITPTVDLTSHAYSSTKPAFDTTGSCWTAPFRDGLPTPPSDMTGVAYNAMPSAAYGAKAHAMPSHLYTHSRPHFDAISSSMVASMKPSHSATHSVPAPAKEAPATEPAGQKKSNGTTASSALRIPSSINNSKGSLAEFAAQVRAHRKIKWKSPYNRTLKLTSIFCR